MQQQTIPVRRGIQAVRAEGVPSDIKALIEGMNQAFATFKAEHTKQLDDIKKGLPSADQIAKVEKINDHLEELQGEIEDAHKKIASAQMGGGGKALHDAEYSAAFQAHFRKGEIQASLNKGNDENGGYLAPVEWDRTIQDKLVIVSPMRSVAAVQSTSKGGFKKLVNMHGTGSGWVGETDARAETSGPTLKEFGFPMGEIYANPAATQTILDDAEINVEAWLAGEVELEFSKQEGVAFISGDGVNKPAGLLTYVTGGVNAAKHPLGAIQVVNSGAAAAITADGIIDLIYDLPGVYAGNARFLMNRLTQRAVRKLKDGEGNYLWQPSFIAGQPATLCGYPLIDEPNMPNVAANAVPITFGDYKRGYQIIDRIGIRVLRDPYTNKPFIMFYTTKRVGGGLLNPEPLRAMKVAAGA